VPKVVYVLEAVQQPEDARVADEDNDGERRERHEEVRQAGTGTAM
jgi:hypothetical protein